MPGFMPVAIKVPGAAACWCCRAVCATGGWAAAWSARRRRPRPEQARLSSRRCMPVTCAGGGDCCCRHRWGGCAAREPGAVHARHAPATHVPHHTPHCITPRSTGPQACAIDTGHPPRSPGTWAAHVHGLMSISARRTGAVASSRARTASNTASTTTTPTRTRARQTSAILPR